MARTYSGRVSTESTAIQAALAAAYSDKSKKNEIISLSSFRDKAIEEPCPFLLSSKDINSYAKVYSRILKSFWTLYIWSLARIPHISHVWCDRNLPHLSPDYLGNPLADRIRINDDDCDRTFL